jgi:protoheme IX farnesyltransferase
VTDNSIQLAAENELTAGSPGAAYGAAYGESRVADFIALLKPRVMSLVVFTGFAGLYVAPGQIHPLLAAVAVLAIAVIDAVMSRTRSRPIPGGRVQPSEALALGVVLSLLSVMMMGLAVNWVAAALLALANGFYVFVYTVWLKRRTPQNIVIGGAAGAFPPMIGWAAVTGSVSLESAALFLIIFMWTPPHFWALALYKDVEYAKAGVPMLPVVAGKAETRRQILMYALLLWPVTLAPWLLGTAGLVYGATALLMGGLFVWQAWRVYLERSERSARQMFGLSILYLFVLFTALIVDAGTGGAGWSLPAGLL